MDRIIYPFIYTVNTFFTKAYYSICNDLTENTEGNYMIDHQMRLCVVRFVGAEEKKMLKIFL